MTTHLRLVALAVLLAAALVPLKYAAAQDTCQSGQSTIVSPPNNYTMPATFDVTANASTSGGCDITALRLYVDNKGVYTAQVGGSSSAGFQKTFTLTEGYHNLVVVSWNNEGYAFTSPAVKIFAAPTNATVYITSPTANQTVSGTVTVAARARWDNFFITAMRAYVDNEAVYTAYNPQYGAIGFQKVFSVGTHYLVVIAWDGAGNHIEANEFFTVQ